MKPILSRINPKGPRSIPITKGLLFAFMTLIMALANPAMAADGSVVSVNFLKGTGETNMPAGDSAGAVAARVNWNNTNGSNAGTTAANISTPTSGKLVDDSGAETALDISWSFGATYAAANSGNADSRMMSGYVDNNTGVGTITVSNITASSYSVYAYIGSDGNGRTGTIGIDGADTYSFTTASASKTYPGNYVQTTNTGTGYPAANYAVWTNLTGSTFTLRHTKGSNNSGVHGIQIVSHGPDVSAVSVSATDAHATEAGQGTGTWTFTRIGNTSEALTVNYTLSGTATTGVDYNVPSTSSVTFPQGVTSVEVTLTPVDDTEAAEGDETATLTLTSGTGYIIVQATADITVYDDEGFDVSILIIGPSHSYSENGESVVVSVNHEEPFDPNAIAINLKSLLEADPALAGKTINVVFEDSYRNKSLDVVNNGSAQSTPDPSSYINFKFHSHSIAQYFLWPEGKEQRMANLRGEYTAWDHIVLLEDPYVLANFPGMHAEAAKLYHDEISKGSAELVLMSQWPHAGSNFTAADFNERSFRVGDSLGLKVAPGAKAWNDLTSKDTSTSHPTPKGAYLGAATLYSTLTTRNAAGFISNQPDSTLAQLGYDTLQTTNSNAQYTGIFTEENKFQMRYNRSRMITGSAQGSSSERGITFGGVPFAAQNCKMSYSIETPDIGNNPIDFNVGRSWDIGRDYIVDPTTYVRSYGFPTGDHQVPDGITTMLYGIDKRDRSDVFDRNTDLGIAYHMILKNEVPPNGETRSLPFRLLNAKINHHRPEIPSHGDTWHMSSQLNRAVGSYLVTLNTGRCPVGVEPTDQNSTEWQYWYAQKIGYETAWQMSHLNARAPGFRVVPTGDVAETLNAVSPDFSQPLSIYFINPPNSNVTVSISVDDSAAGAVSTSSLTFTPDNYNTPQIVNVSGVNRENGTFPFNVIVTTTSDDVVYDGHRDEWDFSNRVTGTSGSVLLAGWDGARPITADEPYSGEVFPIYRAINAPLQSPTLNGTVSAVLQDQNGVLTTGKQALAADKKYLWGDTSFAVKPSAVLRTTAYGNSVAYELSLTITNNNPNSDLRLDAIHWVTVRLTDSPTDLTLSYASGNLDDTDGTSTLVDLTTGREHDISLNFLTDRVLARGESATFKWTPDPSQFTGSNPSLNVENLAISGNLIPSANPNRSPVANAGTDQTVYLSLPTLWTPASINTVAWFDAADSGSLWSDTDGTTPATAKVARWDDKSGNGRHALQTTETHQPTYQANDTLANGMPSIGNPDPSGKIGMDTPTFSAKNIYVVVYYKDGADATFDTYSTLLSGAESNGRYRIMGSQNSANFIGSSNFNDAGTYKNGSISNTLSALSMPVSLFKFKASIARDQVYALGYNQLDSNRDWQGAYCEWIFTDGTEDEATEKKIEGYLAHKWGFADELPTGHTYENQAPADSVVTVNLNGTTTDPDNDDLITTWAVDSGAGSVTFGDGSAATTTATFNTADSYQLRLAASDPWSGVASDTVTIHVVESIPYDDWASGTFTNPFTAAGLTGNPDGDQLTNLQEYAFGLDPTSPINQPLSYVAGSALSQAGVPKLVDDGSNYMAVFTRRKDHAVVGLTYSVEFSADLALWAVAGASPTRQTSVTDTGDYEAVSVPYPSQVPVSGGGAEQAPKFFRVGVQSN